MADARSTLDLSRRLFHAVKAVKTYGIEHPQGQNALGAFKVGLGEALSSDPDILFLCQGDTILIQKVAQPAKDPSVSFLAEALGTHGISSLTFQAGIPPEEIDRAVQLLAAKPEQVLQGNEIKEEFTRGYTRVLINSVRYVAVTDYDAVFSTLDLLPDREESKRFASAILTLSKEKEKSKRPSLHGTGSGSEPRKGHSSLAELAPRIQELLRGGSSPEAKRLVLDQMVNSLTPGEVPLSEQIRQAMDRVPQDLQSLLAGQDAGREISAAIVARQIQSSDDLEALRKTFQELAPRPEDAIALLEAVAGALKGAGREVSPQAMKKAMEFLPQIEQMAEISRGYVLVVDGDSNRRAAYRKAIVERSFAVDTAATAKEAIEKVMTAREVDAMVMDIHLPDKKCGVILTQLLQADRKIPVVIADQKKSGSFDFEVFSYPKKRILQSPEPAAVAEAVSELANRRERRRKAPREEGLARAREVQEKLLPREIPLTPGFEVAFSSRPAGDLGSDFLDIFEVGDGKVAFLLGRVTEKGVGASMVMMRLRIATRLTASSILPPRDSIAQLNRVVAPHIRRGTLVSLVYGSLDLPKGILSLVDCALRPPFLYDPEDGSVRAVSLRDQGLPLGTVPERFEPRLLQEDLDLSPGSVLLFSSPGVLHTQDAEGKPLEESAIVNALKVAGKEEARRVVACIEAAISGHRGNVPRSHDTSLLALRRSPGL